MDPLTNLFGGLGDFFNGMFGGAADSSPAASYTTTEWDPWDRDRGLQIRSPNDTLPAQTPTASVKDYLRQNVAPRLTPARPRSEPADIAPAATQSPEKLSWVAAAEDLIGVKEVAGAGHNEEVVELWHTGKAGDVYDDETPWCAAFVSDRLETSGVQSARTGWARNYLNWGKSTGPAVGSVVVFERGPKFGHVGFVVGKDDKGNLMVLGGNQGNAVSVAPFPTSRVLGYRWPEGQPTPAKTGMASLPVLRGGRLSRNEQ